MNTKRVTYLIAMIALLLVLGLAVAAWACTSQTRLLVLEPSPERPGAFVEAKAARGPSGAQIVVKGDQLPMGTPVEIHWSSLAGAGLTRTRALEDGSFSASITVPEVAPGDYYLVAVPFGGSAAPGRVPFEVTSDKPGVTAGGSTDLWGGFGAARGRQLSAQAGSVYKASGLGLGIGVGVLGLVLSAFCVASAATRRRTRISS